MTSLLAWIYEAPNWVKFIPFLVLVVVNIAIFMAGYIWLWGVIGMVLALVLAIATIGKKSDYNF